MDTKTKAEQGVVDKPIVTEKSETITTRYRGKRGVIVTRYGRKRGVVTKRIPFEKEPPTKAERAKLKKKRIEAALARGSEVGQEAIRKEKARGIEKALAPGSKAAKAAREAKREKKQQGIEKALERGSKLAKAARGQNDISKRIKHLKEAYKAELTGLKETIKELIAKQQAQLKRAPVPKDMFSVSPELQKAAERTRELYKKSEAQFIETTQELIAKQQAQIKRAPVPKDIAYVSPELRRAAERTRELYKTAEAQFIETTQGLIDKQRAQLKREPVPKDIAYVSPELQRAADKTRRLYRETEDKLKEITGGIAGGIAAQELLHLKRAPVPKDMFSVSPELQKAAERTRGLYKESEAEFKKIVGELTAKQRAQLKREPVPKDLFYVSPELKRAKERISTGQALPSMVEPAATEFKTEKEYREAVKSYEAELRAYNKRVTEINNAVLALDKAGKSVDLTNEGEVNKHNRKIDELNRSIDRLKEPVLPGEPPTTIGSLVYNWLAREEKSQAELKKEYEKHEALPFWGRLLNTTSVVLDPKTGLYHQVIIGEPPIIGPGGPTKLTRLLVDIGTKKLPSIVKSTTRQNLKLLTPKDLGITEQQFARLIQLRVDQLGKAGIRLSAKDIEKQNKLLTALRLAIKEGDKGKIKLLTEELDKIVARPIVKKALREATSVEARQAIPGRLTASRLEELLIEGSKMKPSEGLRQLLAQNAVLPALAVNAALVVSLINNADSKTRAEALAGLSTELQNAIKTGNLTKAETLAFTQLQTKTKTKTEAFGKTETKPATIGMVKPQIRPATKTKLKPALKPATITKLKPAIKPAIKPATKPAIKPAIKPALKPALRPKKPPIRPIIKLRPGDSSKAIKEFIKASGGAVGLRMGELNKKDIWHVKTEPYTGKHFVLVGKLPLGAKLVKGPGSGYKTAFFYGKRPAFPVRFDIGLQDVLILPRANKVIAMFKPERGISSRSPSFSRGELRLSSKPPRITPRAPRITR